MIKNNIENYIGKTFNNIKVISFSHFLKSGKNNRKYYNILCLNCNETSTTREDHLTDKVKNETCKKC